MKLPKSLTTVTTFSKILAGLLFITLPVVGFYLGMQFQKEQDSARPISEIGLDCLPFISQKINNPSASSSLPLSTSNPLLITNLNLNHNLDMTNWQTTTIEKMNINFKHPTNWFLSEYTASSDMAGSPKYPAFGLTTPIMVDINKYKQYSPPGVEAQIRFSESGFVSIIDAEQILDQNTESQLKLLSNLIKSADKKSIYIDGSNGLLVYRYNPSATLDHAEGYICPNKCYLIIFDYEETAKNENKVELQTIFEQILSTIKFIK
jgi:hypothetical protein